MGQGWGSSANLAAESSTDDKTATIEAAKARAAARRAERLAQNGEAPKEQLPPLQGASAPAAGEGWGGGNVPDSSANIETTTDTAPASPDDAKTAAIEAAKARAAARKAARLAQNSEADTPTASASPSVQPPPPVGEGRGGGSKQSSAASDTDTAPAPHQLPPDDAKTAAIEAAKARAAARKTARLAQNGEAPTGQPITLPQTEEQAETSMTPPDNDDKTARDAKLAAARAKSEERRIAHAKLKQHMRDTAIPIRPQPDEHQ